MGRKPISPKQRSIPVSFSVKPKLADRIEDMAYDQRFTRSKFLSEAVLRYINWIEMGGLEGTDDVSEMSATRKVVIGLNALGAAVREQDFSIPNNILQELSRAIDLYKMSESNAKTDSEPPASEEVDIAFEKVPNKSEYQVLNMGSKIGTIHKLTSKHRGKAKGTLWILTMKGAQLTYKTLKAAKAAVLEEWS
ncbi:MAG: hypothetical protein GY845_26060 [Planctomycetes bacterium]|nr:hypothetical protein [Planctomycetota bacterium]